MGDVDFKYKDQLIKAQQKFTKPPQKVSKWVKTRIRVKRYEFGCVVARGAFSKVYLARTSNFLLAEDSSERTTVTSKTLPSKITRSLRKKNKNPNGTLRNRKNLMYREAGTKLQLPRYVAIKVMKVKRKKPKAMKKISNFSKKHFFPESAIDPEEHRLTRSTMAVSHFSSYFDSEDGEEEDHNDEPCASRLIKKRESTYKKQEAEADQEEAEAVEDTPNSPKMAKNFKDFLIKRRKLEDIMTEIDCLKMVRECYFCIYLHDVVILEREVWMVTEYAHIGELSYFCRKRFPDGRVPPRFICWFLAPIMLALEFLNQRGLIHRDIKDGNILLTRAGVPKLCDFGLVRKFETTPLPFSESFAGTPAFAPPEVFMGSIHYHNQFKRRELYKRSLRSRSLSETQTAEIDIEIAETDKLFDTTFDTWSLGMTMLSLNYGSSPWEYSPQKKRYRRARFPQPRVTRYLGRQLSKEVKMFGYGKLHKRLGLLEAEEILAEEHLQVPKTVPLKDLVPFDAEKRKMVNFVKRCAVLRTDRKTVSEMMDDEFVKDMISQWEAFDARIEQKMAEIAKYGTTYDSATGKEGMHNFSTNGEFVQIAKEVALLVYKCFPRSDEHPKESIPKVPAIEV